MLDETGANARSADHTPADRARRMIGVLQRRHEAGEDVDDPIATIRALERAGFSRADVHAVFGSLRRLERAAGVIAIPADEYREPDTLLADMHRIARVLGRAPARGEYEFFGRFSETAFRRRFKTDRWAVILRAFGRYLVRNHGTDRFDKHELERLGVRVADADADARGAAAPAAAEGRDAQPAPARPPRRLEPPVLGAPLVCESFANAPINEQSVVGLFCAVAHRLGFIIRYVDDRRYPDIWALRRLPGRDERWRETRIEVQLRAKDFVRDGHDANEVDVAVAWEDNWPAAERPAHVEVIELQRVIRGLPAACACGGRP